MGFFDDLGTFGKDIFTGRWTGGETNVVQDVKNDPWVLAAPAALAAGGLGIGLAAEGAGGLGALFGGEAAAGGAGEALAFAPEAAGGAPAFSPVGGDFEALGLPSEITAGTSQPTALSTLNLGDLGGGTGGITDAAGATGATGGVAPTGAPAGGSGPLDTLLSPDKWTLGGVAQGLGVAAAGAGLAMNLKKGNSVPASQDRLNNQAAFNSAQAKELIGESKQLRSYLENGSLPPAQQAAVDQALKAEKARIVANHAKNGASTDPTQNSALAQDISSAERNALVMAGQLEQQLFAAGQSLLQSGLAASGLSSQIYQALTQMDRGDTKDLNTAIATFASALGGGGAKINLSMAR